MTYTDWMLAGFVCAALVVWAIRTARYEPRESFDAYDDARVDTIRDELDMQEMKTNRVRCIS